jgi:uncharacterized protein
MPTFPSDSEWRALGQGLDAEGFATLGPLLSADECAELTELFEDGTSFRSTVVMARHQFGDGLYKYFGSPLHPTVQALRERLYGPLAQIANQWSHRLQEPAFPSELGELLTSCAALGQTKPTPLLLAYGPGGYNCLHQDVYGDLTFPLQVAVMLSRPDEDFTGGESVFVEQRPRAQSRPAVARPRQGEGLVFPVRHRPVPGSRGDRRVTMRHGVSRVRSGRRFVLGVIFHDAR